jgi:hypothetical protein
MNGKAVPSLGRLAFMDGHDNNESYKLPVPHPTRTDNLSYMHPHDSQLSPTKPWQSVDKTLDEAGRHPSQLSLSKTVFPVSTEKQRGAPKPKLAPLQATKALKLPSPGIK